MQNKINIDFKIRFQTPFHCGTGMSAGLIDRRVKRNNNGLIFIPASTFKGVLRNKIEDLIHILNASNGNKLINIHPNDSYNTKILFYFHKEHKATPIERIFGSAAKSGSLFFQDLTMVDEDKNFFKTGESGEKYDKLLQVETRTQTTVYRTLNTVKQGSLFSSELGIKDLQFQGRIYGWLNGIPVTLVETAHPHLISYELFFLILGMKLMDKIAADKSTGMGNFEYTDISLSVNSEKVDIEQNLFCDEIFDALSLYNDEMEIYEENKNTP